MTGKQSRKKHPREDECTDLIIQLLQRGHNLCRDYRLLVKELVDAKGIKEQGRLIEELEERLIAISCLQNQRSDGEITSITLSKKDVYSLMFYKSVWAFEQGRTLEKDSLLKKLRHFEPKSPLALQLQLFCSIQASNIANALRISSANMLLVKTCPFCCLLTAFCLFRCNKTAEGNSLVNTSLDLCNLLLDDPKGYIHSKGMLLVELCRILQRKGNMVSNKELFSFINPTKCLFDTTEASTLLVLESVDVGGELCSSFLPLAMSLFWFHRPEAKCHFVRICEWKSALIGSSVYTSPMTHIELGLVEKSFAIRALLTSAIGIYVLSSLDGRSSLSVTRTSVCNSVVVAAIAELVVSIKWTSSVRMSIRKQHRSLLVPKQVVFRLPSSVVIISLVSCVLRVALLSKTTPRERILKRALGIKSKTNPMHRSQFKGMKSLYEPHKLSSRLSDGEAENYIHCLYQNICKNWEAQTATDC